ncbi:hypothetical protein NEOLEDRAFT_1174860 [Neolentinus lepideus HHB14362 ss-1]|uniref:Sodium/calcium exchanger membrane region domain-containing protein n=1 Tax=Neolentinus lepideus HHB14362 ss-1 TaxID=1314782 RepID=A0A165VM25_9AGAM|nr:hypothetical protein NEOLEDRAFT_1174860 [Neolentinus lepideus HHB14362 ss-1]
MPMQVPPHIERSNTGLSNCSCTSTSQLVLDAERSNTSPAPHRRGRSCWPTRLRRRPTQSGFGLDKAGAKTAEAHPVRRRAKHPWDGWKVIILDSWLNLLLVLIPVSWILEFTLEGSSALIFIFCVLSMVPLVKLHDLATNELAIRIGGSRTGLLNASMSNIVELVFAISALRKCELRVVQSSLVGSILSKLLLVLGMCFFAGGTRFTEQGFDATATNLQSSLLIISVSAVLLPCAYHFTIARASEEVFDEQKQDLLKMSHGVSIILLTIYGAYLLFQLYSHTHLYHDKHSKTSTPHPYIAATLTKTSRSTEPLKPSVSTGAPNIAEGASAPADRQSPNWTESTYQGSVRSRKSFTISRPGSPIGGSFSAEDSATIVGKDGTVASRGAVPAPEVDPTVKLVQSFYANDSRSRETIVILNEKTEVQMIERADPDGNGGKQVEFLPTNHGESAKSEHPEHHEKHPQLSWLMTMALLTAVTVKALLQMVSVNADQLVESMDGISTHIDKTWVALILLPTVGSIAECVTAINTSVKDELTLSISVAVGSTVQTALFVIPFVVILGWILDKPLALLFDPFESVVLYISVHTMTSVVQDGKSNWLEGAILICLYAIIAVAFWFYPASDISNTLAACT